MLWIRPKAWKMKFKEDRPLATPEAAEQLIGADRGGHQRHDRSCERTRRGLTGHRIGVGRCRFGRQRNWRGARSQHTGNLAFDIVGEFARAGLGEIYAVVGTQLADLAFEVRALLQEAAGLVDKAVPDIDVSDAGFASGIARLITRSP
jgi:hypothetical protein